MAQPLDVPVAQLRASRAVAFFGTWMLIGLFLDGWSHTNDAPETFFSPWHGVLYSGFVAAVAWFAWDGWRARTNAEAAAATDRWGTAGLVVFVAGAVGDGLWHQLFGIEADIEALLSPTHLALMIGGALMVTSPLRVAWSSLPERPTLRAFLPALVSLALVTSLVLFFLMYLSAAWPIAQVDNASSDDQGRGIASVLVRTTVMLGSALLVLRRWTPPFGTFTLLFSVPAIALAGLEAFAAIALVFPFFVGGVIGDVVVARTDPGRRRAQLFGVVVPLASWLGYFAVHAVAWGVHWPAEIWTGATVLATLTGFGGALLTEGLAEQHTA
jgi:hypothetical protein